MSLWLRDLGRNLWIGALLVFGQSDDHGQRELIELLCNGVAPHAVPAVRGKRDRRVSLIRTGYYARIVDGDARGQRVTGASGQKYAVGSQQTEHAVLAEFYGVVAADEISGIDGDQRGPGKHTVSRIESAAKLQRPFS